MPAPDDLTGQEDVLPKDDLSGALESALERTTTPPDTSVAAPTDKPAAAPAEGERQRDAFGRFVPKPEGEGAPAAAPAVTGTTTGAAAPVAGAADPTAQAPASWTDEARAGWDKVPTELRGYLHQRDNELQAGFRAVSERANAAAAVINEFMPYADILEQERASPVEAIRTLLQTAYALRTGGQEYRKAILHGLAQQYGVDMTQGFDPNVAQTEAQLAAMNTEKLQQGVQQTQRTEYEVTQAYNAFANDPKNEFFPQVRTVMAGIIGNGLATDLGTAYNMALGMVPEVRATLLQRQVEATAKAAQQAANGANLSVSGAPGGGAASKAPDRVKDSDLRSQLEAGLNAAGVGG
jgi:hypothetical protein